MNDLSNRTAGRAFMRRNGILSRHQSGHGFTLVELLVVIGIIALLIAILLPALSVARESASSLKCLSNLRQMAIAAHLYANENQGYYPPALMSGSDANYTYAYNWDYTIITERVSPFKAKYEPGLLWAGQADLQIQQCPSFYGKAMALNNPYTGYNYNTSYIGRGLLIASGIFDPPARVVKVRRPSETALFGDGQYKDGANKYMRSPTASGYISDNGVSRFGGTQGFRHRGRTNVAFCDGHAESLSQRFTGTNVTAGTGFISADNSLYDLE